MAGDWIKLRTALPDDGRLRIVAKKCHASSVTTLGALVTLWCLADAHAAEDGTLLGYDAAAIDEKVNLLGFCAALPSDWIDLSGEWVKLPEYQEHNGSTAKARAQTTKRKRKERTVTSVTDKSRSDRDVSVTREEKRREEKKTPADDGLFDSFWRAYPRKVAKQDAAKAFAKLAPNAELMKLILAAIAVQSASEAWTKDGGKFVPHPATWLNGKRWADEAESTGGGSDPQWFEGAI